MAQKTNYLRNKQIDAFWRGQAFSNPATHYFGLLTSTRGPRANSTAYALNDTISVIVSGEAKLYKATTAGTSASSQPGTYAGVEAEVITDGTAVFTEQSTALRAGGGVEPTGNGYARVAVAASLANFAGTQADGSTTASSGTTGKTSNNGLITWPAPTGAGWGFVWGVQTFDASSAGNPLVFDGMNTPKTINGGDAAPSFPIGASQWFDDV